MQLLVSARLACHRHPLPAVQAFNATILTWLSRSQGTKSTVTVTSVNTYTAMVSRGWR